MYLAPTCDKPLSEYFSRAKQSYVYRCDDEGESVDVRVHLYRGDENASRILVFYRSIGIDPELLTETQRKSN